MISVCIQHHPARTEMLWQLEERLEGADVVTDPDPNGKPNPLRCYRECLRRTPTEATHRVVIQDDTWPCNGFREKAEAAIAERPENLIAFFVPGTAAGGQNRVLRAAEARESWAQIGGTRFTPVVALSWPVHLIEPFLEFSEQPRYVAMRSDDEVVGRFAKRQKMEIWATVPSLIEHPDRVPSLIGRVAGAGKNRSRVAALFAD